MALQSFSLVLLPGLGTVSVFRGIAGKALLEEEPWLCKDWMCSEIILIKKS